MMVTKLFYTSSLLPLMTFIKLSLTLCTNPRIQNGLSLDKPILRKILTWILSLYSAFNQSKFQSASTVWFSGSIFFGTLFFVFSNMSLWLPPFRTTMDGPWMKTDVYPCTVYQPSVRFLCDFNNLIVIFHLCAHRFWFSVSVFTLKYQFFVFVKIAYSLHS